MARMRSVMKLQPKVPEKHLEDPENALGFLPGLVSTYGTFFVHFPSLLSLCISIVVQYILETLRAMTHATIACVKTVGEKQTRWRCRFPQILV